ncbi:Hsp70 family protein [Dactylosporangium sp. NPDC049140]|uniref:Hsp70 family protein n=1 Tax=Dactylosporangium sp. NPDC049140 TaxID=3155647 RepID=UPI0033CA4607
MSRFALAVDYGTSNTVAILRWPDGKTRPLLFDGSPLLPSAVHAMPDGHLATGRDAINSAKLDPVRFEPNPKRHVDEPDLLLGDATVPLTAAVAATLARVAAEARQVAGRGVDDLVMTYPAEWGSARRGVLTEAARRAGFPPPRLVPEPVAAGLYFTAVLGRGVPPGASVVVYDLGAGTFDASVVRRGAGGFETLAYRGLDDVGGVDLDELVVQQIGGVAGASDPEAWARLSAPRTAPDRRAARALRDDARMLKERLSRESSAGLLVPILDRDLHVTRDELEQRARPLIAQTVAVTAATVAASGVPREQVAGLFLVGGSTRMPLVATELHRALGIAPTVLDQPELVVAEGALVTEIPAHQVPAPPAPARHPAMPAQHPVTPPMPMPIPAQHPVTPPAPMPAQRPPSMPVSATPVSPQPVSPGWGAPSPVSPGAAPIVPQRPIIPQQAVPMMPAPPAPLPPFFPAGGRMPAEFRTGTGAIIGKAAARILWILPFFLGSILAFGAVYEPTGNDDLGIIPTLLIWVYILVWLGSSIVRMVRAPGEPHRLLIDEHGLTVTVRGRAVHVAWAQLERVEVRRRGFFRRPTLLIVPRPGTGLAAHPDWRGRVIGGGEALKVADLRTLGAHRTAVSSAVRQYLPA